MTCLNCVVASYFHCDSLVARKCRYVYFGKGKQKTAKDD